MSKLRLVRSVIAIGSIATLLSTAFPASAAEIKPLVVVGIAADAVTLEHPTPAYPPRAREFRIEGDVRVHIQVAYGRIVNVSAESTEPMLAKSSANWVRRSWKFKPSANGDYVLPISYRLST
jgi:Gram-negative bacterial TonB protein C-terminal